MTKIHLSSDNHVEFQSHWILNPGADVLILSGDILTAKDLDRDLSQVDVNSLESIEAYSTTHVKAAAYLKFLHHASRQFAHVVYVAGNHEFYGFKWLKTIEVLKQVTSRFPNIHYLENSTVNINDITFVGATLWTDMNKGDPITLQLIKDELNDYHHIRNDERDYCKLRPEHTVVRHKKTLEYFKSVIDANPTGKFVVVTHHGATPLSINLAYADEYILNGAYMSDLSNFILDRPQIKLWTSGHTHHAYNYMMGSTQVHCNPRGYPGQHTGYNPELIIEV